LDIRVAEQAGFCFGVQRAYDMALAATEVTDGPLCSWGPLIHNPQVVHFLEGRGLKVITELNEVSRGARVVIRSHGVSPEIFRGLRKRGAQVIDATCPFVKKAQSKLSQLEKEGYQVLLLGDRAHAEVQTLIGYAQSEVEIINGLSDLATVGLGKRVGVLSQTTQGEAVLKDVVSYLSTKTHELKVFNTICGFTAARSRVALRMAGEVDLLLVVGGKSSANTARLRDTCRAVLPDTYQVETSDEIKPDWLNGKSKIGITAGASTPQWVILEVINRLRDLVSAREPKEALLAFLKP